jgi:hypothetical protein
MAHRHIFGISIALLVGLLPALLVGRYLFTREGQHAQVAPSPSPQVVAAAPVATSIPTAMATIGPTAIPVPTATPTLMAVIAPDQRSPTAVPTPTSVPATATPAGPTWVDVGHWRDSQLIVTETFTVYGPWRIRWHLASSAEPFTVMVEEGTATPILLFGPTGATDGVIDEPQGGTFNLMLHNTIAYDVIVEDLRPPASTP